MTCGALLCTQARSLADDGLTVIAGKIYEEVLKEEPTDAEALLGMGLLLYHEDKRRAVTWIRRAVHVDPGDAARWSQLATACYKGGFFADAAHAFRMAVVLAPAATESWLGLGDILDGHGDGAPAAAAYRNATSVSMEQSKAHFRVPSVILANRPPLWVETLSRIADHPATFAMAPPPSEPQYAVPRRATAGFPGMA
jgi:uncharacterized protein HemY